MTITCPRTLFCDLTNELAINLTIDLSSDPTMDRTVELNGSLTMNRTIRSISISIPRSIALWGKVGGFYLSAHSVSRPRYRSQFAVAVRAQTPLPCAVSTAAHMPILALFIGARLCQPLTRGCLWRLLGCLAHGRSSGARSGR